MNKNFFKLNEKYQIDTYKKASNDDEIIALKKYFVNIEIPQDYISFISQLTEAEILVLGKSYIRIWGAMGCIEMNSVYNIQKYIPGSVAIGDDEGGKAIFYATGKKGFGLYQVGFGDLDINSAEFISHSLDDFLFDGVGAELFYIQEKNVNSDSIIQQLVSAFNNSQHSIGIMEYKVKSTSNNDPHLSPHDQLGYFYNQVTLKDNPTFGGDFYIQLFENEQLNIALEGWEEATIEKTECLHWNKNYVIFAERNGDVLFCDTSISECPVYGSVQKRKFQVANSLMAFFTVFIEMINIEENIFNNDTTDDDFNHKPEYLSIVENKIRETLSQEFTEGFYYFFFG